MIERVFDAERINAVCNHPGVRPWLGGGTGALDFTGILNDRRNVLLMVDGGGVLFHFQEPTIYEAHTQFVPEVRGSAALRATLDAIEWMFLNTDCLEILSKAPHDNPAAKRWAQLSGGKLRFVRHDCWDGAQGPCGIDFFGLTLEDWIERNATMLYSEGRRFHAALPDNGTHAEDSAHDCAVGTSLLMAQHGQLIKAVVLYNRWARFAGYSEIKLVSMEPPVIDLGTCSVKLVGDTLEVL